MFKRAWIAGIAIGLSLCFSGYVIAQSPEQSIQHQTESEGQGKPSKSGTSPFSIPIRILEEPEEADGSKRQQEEAAKREEKDLRAQQSMADSTQEIVWFTKLQFALAVAGTVALIYTICLNRKATNAAVAAVKLTRKIGHLQTRPYVTAAGIKSEIIENCYVGRIKFINMGETPAVIVDFAFRHDIGERPTRDAAFSQLDIKPFPTVIGPSGSPHIGAVKANLRATIDLRKGQPIFIWGVIVYRESGGTELFYTEFGYKVSVTHETTVPNSEDSMRVNMVSDEIPSFCTIDQDCFHYKAN